jgi:hypothetical protein
VPAYSGEQTFPREPEPGPEGPAQPSPAPESPAPETSPPATGYTLVLPAGWRRIPARHGTDQAIRDILDEVFGRLSKNLPRDKVYPYRAEFERRLTGMVAEARKKAALDLYLPVENIHGTPVPASFIVSQGPLGGAESLEPAHILAYLASERENASTVDVDGAMGVRMEQTAPPDEAQEFKVGSRRVDYVLSVPGVANQWLIVAFSTVGSGDPDGEFARVLVELFDAMMSTFRWTRAGAEHKGGEAADD